MHLQVLRQAGHVELVLDRPERRNALSGALLSELTHAVTGLASDRAVRSLIITGASPAFCAGLDLREVEQAGAALDNTPLAALPARTLAETKALFRRLREVRGDETELRRLNALLSRDDMVL